MPVLGEHSQSGHIFNLRLRPFHVNAPGSIRGNSQNVEFSLDPGRAHHRSPGRRETQTVTNGDEPRDVAEEKMDWARQAPSLAR
jgi:hypothetical protein